MGVPGIVDGHWNEDAFQRSSALVSGQLSIVARLVPADKKAWGGLRKKTQALSRESAEARNSLSPIPEASQTRIGYQPAVKVA
jgi:hypothetical protein